MKSDLIKLFSAGLLMILGVCCKQPYNPPVINNPPSYLVVDGILTSGDSAVIALGRTHGLYDSVSNVPETGAQVMVLGDAADSYSFTERGGGNYFISFLSLNPNEKYQLKITTSDGKQYESDTISLRQTPPIDSVNWVYNESTGVKIFVNTHDPQNNTKFYRWDYQETWEYRSKYQSLLEYDSGQLRNRTTQVYRCWHSRNSTELLLASSEALSQDIIYLNPILSIAQGDQRLSVEYSILVRQYALSREAFDFWENLKKNTELTGSIFAPQPSQSVGNIHSLSNPGEPVLGYVSAASVQEQRIFISNLQIPTWQIPQSGCQLQIITPDSVDIYFGHRGYIPVGTYGISDYTGTFPSCADCTTEGGIPIKPPFWP